MTLLTTLPVFVLATIVYVILYRRRTHYVKRIRGPPGSFWRGTYPRLCTAMQIYSQILLLIGNVRNFSYQENVGDLDFKYVKEYGLVYCLGAPLGVGHHSVFSPHDLLKLLYQQDVLMIADPKVSDILY